MFTSVLDLIVFHLVLLILFGCVCYLLAHKRTAAKTHETVVNLRSAEDEFHSCAPDVPHVHRHGSFSLKRGERNYD